MAGGRLREAVAHGGSTVFEIGGYLCRQSHINFNRSIKKSVKRVHPVHTRPVLR